MLAATVDAPPRLPPARQTLRVVREAEYAVRQRLDEYEEGGRSSALSELARDLVVRSLLPLEMTLLTACMGEMAAEHGAETYRELAAHSPASVWGELCRRMRMPNLAEVVAEHTPEVLRRAGLTIEQMDALDQPVPTMATLLRQAHAIVAACPIDVIEQAAKFTDMTDLGHRCRVAYDGLQAFLRRASPARRARLDELGKLYAAGKLSVSECARILDVSPPDLIAEFEERGHWRALPALSDEQRGELLRRIREDRLRRGGRPEFASERALRSALASERIEGVDARPWLPTQS